MGNEVEVNDELVNALNEVAIESSEKSGNENCNDEDENNDCCYQRFLVLDAGYGFPREKKVRKEKINAIASQVSNFLVWQIAAAISTATERSCAVVKVVGCPDESIKTSLENRIMENMKRASPINETNLPPHVTVSCESLEECLEALEGCHPAIATACIDGSDSDNPAIPVYLSPDAPKLDPTREPPRVSVVGLLIDRRVQPNRSRDRAGALGIVARRWPLDDCFAEIDACEPLNVDCVMEGMQQWWWNWIDATSDTSNGVSTVDRKSKKETFIQAATQAIEHHARRHPSRPLHIVKSN